jgi:hypothetical protein
LITIAENPKIIIRSLIKGMGNTVPWPVVAGFFASSLLNKRKSKNEMLHIKVNLEKNEMVFI